MESILAKIEAHEAETRRLNEELFAERDATQSKIEQLTTYRYELDQIIQRRGLRSDVDEHRSVHVPTNDPRIVKRSNREKADYVATVPVERGGSTIAQVVRNILSDGEMRSKAEIFELVRLQKPEVKRSTLDSMIPLPGFHSSSDTRIGKHPAARVYWLPKGS